MELALLLDIGSTYTKAVVINLAKIELQAKVKTPTTVQTNLSLGIKDVLEKLEKKGINLDKVEHRLACSSAAGGLEMVAIGLVPELTAKAAKRAALGAGAKVKGVYSYELNNDELKEINEQEPDIILLAGGTDGGNQEIILQNAKILAESDLTAPVIVAGNKVVAEDLKEILENGGQKAYITENVMPKLDELNIKPARKVIRQIFLDNIIYAKGLSKAEKYIDQVIMPTPFAVMKAAELIAEGTSVESGLGELIVIDIGGATTDVHSVAKGEPTKSGISVKGLEEPYVKRTVEGDLGMRYSATSLLETAGIEELLTYLPESINKAAMIDYINKIDDKVEYVPNNELEKKLDSVIAKVATKLAIRRHVGRIETVYTPFGENQVQYGKDLTNLNLIIGTGGILVHNDYPGEILQQGLFTEKEPIFLAPVEPKLMLDENYILASVGLLAEISATKAIKFAKKYLKKVGGSG